MEKNQLLNVPVRYNTKISVSLSSIHKLNPEFSLCDVDVLYVNENRNGTDISKDVVEDALYSLYGVPIVGEWLEDENRFGDHGEKIEISRDKITCTITTKPIGFVTQEAINTAEWIEKPLPNGHELKTWLRLHKCILWTGRYKEAQSIIENGTSQSMEVKFLDGTYKENGYFKPSKMIFSALCAIGVEPCFEEANIRRAEYELDSFKLELQTMLNEYKKFNESDGTTATVQNNATNNNPQMEGEQSMDFAKITEALSAHTYKGVDNDLLHKLIEHGRGQLVKAGVAVNQGHKLVHPASLLLHRFHFSGQTLQLAFKLLLFRFILLGKFQKSLVCQLTRNVILIGALN